MTDIAQKEACTETLVEGDEQGVPTQALAYLQKFLTLAHFDAVATIGHETAEEITLDIEGPDAPLLIGRHGQTLDALQYLLIVMVTTGRVTAGGQRITVDVEGYRQRRADTLTHYAQSLAAQVRDTHEEAVLEPLNPLERRIVHTALMDDPYVETYSEGYGPDRHIVITPRKPGSAGASQSAETDV
jgi:spoIIIJ-associated protein